MDKNSKLRAGILGVAGRGHGFVGALVNFPETELVALCDINAEGMDKVYKGYNLLPDVKRYVSYEEMLEKENLDMVVISTPINLHFEQAALALRENIHVFGEVPAVYDLEEAKSLTEICRNSNATYMMAENANYFKSNLIIKEMVQEGIFGDLYYADAEYLHNCRLLTEQYTSWRYKCIYGRNGIVYGTHSLGPVLSWFEGDRVAHVCCTGSGNSYIKPDGSLFKLNNTCVMMCKTEMGRLIKIRIDFTSPRPGTNRYQLQGTKAAFESQHHEKDFNRIFISDEYFEEKIDYYDRLNKHPEYDQWRNLGEYENKYLPQKYKAVEETAMKYGHDCADYFMMVDYIDALYNGRTLPIDIHRSLDITLPGFISEQSIESGGLWMEVPDSRKW
jgi:Predicted dehydrogenases and related proteins